MRHQTPRKQTPPTRGLNWPCLRGEPIVAWIRVGKEQYPYTAAMLKRRAERLKEAKAA